MNPYDVLGVRPTASADEIELAYRSRRTQYHPDKYVQHDAGTLQWATGKMQEVNIAYQALKAGHHQIPSQASGTFDARAGRSHGQATPHSGESAKVASLADVVAQHAQRFAQASRVYPAPNIPLQKLHAALQSYGGGIDPQEVLLLTDSTVFGGAKEGILLTEKRIRGKGFGDSLQDFQWREIRHVELKDTVLWINGEKFAEGMRVERWEIQKVMELITTFLAHLTADTQGAERSPATPDERTEEKKAQVLQLAKDRVIELSEFAQELEQIVGGTLVDLDAAIRFFDVIEESLADSRYEENALFYIVTVLELCKSARIAVKDLDVQIHPSLWHSKHVDPPFVRSLRELLAQLLQLRPELRYSQSMRDVFPG